MDQQILELTINGDQLQDLNNRQLGEYLKQAYKINLNISQSLSKAQKQEVITILENSEAVRKLVMTLVAKNQELGNNNRKFGKQREDAKRDLVESQERNEELANEISLIRFQLNEMRKMLTNSLEILQQQLINNMLTRSEIITVFKELIFAVDKNKTLTKK
jgi:hypothetical protein